MFVSSLINPEIIKSYGPDSDGSYYKIFSDGTCIQGGRFQGYDDSNVSATATVNLLVPYKDTKYIVQATADTISYFTSVVRNSRTTTNFQLVTVYHDGSGYLKSFYWETVGAI